MLSRIVSGRSQFGRRYFVYFVAAWVILIACFVVVERWADSKTTAYHEIQFNEQQVAQVLLAKRGIEDRVNVIKRDMQNLATLLPQPETQIGSDRKAIVSSFFAQSLEIISISDVSPRGREELMNLSADAMGHSTDMFSHFTEELLLSEADADTWVSDYTVIGETVYAALAIKMQSEQGAKNASWIMAVINLSNLFDAYVAPLRVGKFGAGYVLDHTGKILYDHEPEVIGRNVFDGLHAKYPALEELDRKMVSMGAGTGEYQFTVARGGETSRKLVAWNSLEFGGSRMIIAMSAPDSEIHASIDESRRIVFVAVLLLALGFIVTTYVFVRMRQRLMQVQTEEMANRVAEKTDDLNRELQARTESEDRFRDFAESTSDWLWEMDRDLKFTFISDRYQEITGFVPDFAIGKTRGEMISGGVDAVVLNAHLATLMNRRAFRDFRYDLKAPSSQQITANISGKPVFDQHGNFTGYRGVGSNMTVQVHAQRARDAALREAERANKAKSEFLAAMSHELRTPLNAILGFSEVIHLQLLGPDDAKKYNDYAHDIHTSAAHLLALVNDLLDVSAIEAGQIDVHFETVDIGPLIEESLQTVRDVADRNGIKIALKIADDMPDVHADPRAVRQILLNLLSNATKFSQSGCIISVSGKGIENGVEVTVKDTGIGIPAERLTEVTRPFVRGQRDPYKAERGWGLGLSIVSALVDLHGGELKIHSQVGAGTTVSFTLKSREDVKQNPLK